MRPPIEEWKKEYVLAGFPLLNKGIEFISVCDYALDLEAKLETMGRSLIAEQKESMELQDKLERVEKCLEELKRWSDLWRRVHPEKARSLASAADLLEGAFKEEEG